AAHRAPPVVGDREDPRLHGRARAHPPRQPGPALAALAHFAAEALGKWMAAIAQRTHALAGVEDRYFLRAEVIGIEHSLQWLTLLQRAPIRARARPGTVGAADRKSVV